MPLRRSSGVSLSYRTSNDSISWSDWSAWDTSSPIDINAVKERYVQVQAKLTTTNAEQTPTLHWIKLTYTT